MSKKISVIMASYLGDYVNRSTNPKPKFIRAVKSFLSQSYENKELIIVSDGCQDTVDIYNSTFSKFNNIKLVYIEKQPIYSGLCRNAGIDIADGDIITYLDNDDVIGKNHLQIISDELTDDVDMIYYDDYLVLSKDFKNLNQRYVEPAYGSIGTSSISHKNPSFFKDVNIRWINGYGHDFFFVLSLINNGYKFKKASKPSQYLVCHYGNISQGGGDF
jgi:glycosyltransferase involved in cell wall biosynthesis